MRREKNSVLNLIRDSSFRRTPQDRLELMLALFGHTGRVYCLTFSDDYLPENFKGVREVWRHYLRQLRKVLGRSFDYIYVIEGKHGDHRYHIHLVLRDEDFSPAIIRKHWGYGHVDSGPLLLSPEDSFLRTAIYFTKERTDGVVLPIGCRTWVASRSLTRQLQPPEKWRSDSGEIPVPDCVGYLAETTKMNPFGMFRFASFIEQK